MSREYMMHRWCIRCGRHMPTPFLKRCAAGLEAMYFDYGKNLEEYRVLDIGCGNGRNSEYMKSIGFRVSSVDMKPDYGRGVILGSSRLPFRKGAINIVLANYVLMFLDRKERKQLFKELARVMAADSTLIWELYPAKDSYCKNKTDIRAMMQDCVRFARKLKMKKIYRTKDKAMYISGILQ